MCVQSGDTVFIYLSWLLLHKFLIFGVPSMLLCNYGMTGSCTLNFCVLFQQREEDSQKEVEVEFEDKEGDWLVGEVHRNSPQLQLTKHALALQ